MESKKTNLALLLGLSFLWFICGIIATFIFSFALGSYSEAGEHADPMMLVSLATIVAFPMFCVHTLIYGWRRFLVGDYPPIIKVALLPFPFVVFVFLIFESAWP